MDPALIEPSRLVFEIEIDPNRPVGGSAQPGVTDMRFVSLAADKQSVVLSFAQSGVGVARVTCKVNHTLEGVGSTGSPIIAISSQDGGGVTPTTTGLTRSYVPGVLLNDVVYENGTALTVDRADASAAATAQVLGVVSALDVPAVGQCTVAVTATDLPGFIGLTTGARYILASTPGGIVDESDTGNLNYPAYLTPGSGEALAPVGVAGSATSLAVNTGAGIVAVG